MIHFTELEKCNLGRCYYCRKEVESSLVIITFYMLKDHKYYFSWWLNKKFEHRSSEEKRKKSTCDLNESPNKGMLMLLSLQTAHTVPSLITLDAPCSKHFGSTSPSSAKQICVYVSVLVTGTNTYSLQSQLSGFVVWKWVFGIRQSKRNCTAAVPDRGGYSRLSVGKHGLQTGEVQGLTDLVQLTIGAVRSTAPLCSIWGPSFNQRYLRDLHVTFIKLRGKNRVN